MKSIELTGEQKNKLLEMAKRLFPEYDNIYFQQEEDNNPQLYWLEFSKIKVSPGTAVGLSSKTEITRIHWYEFCMHELLNNIITILLAQKSSGIVEYAKRIDMQVNTYYIERKGETHIVDYLYELNQNIKPLLTPVNKA